MAYEVVTCAERKRDAKRARISLASLVRVTRRNPGRGNYLEEITECGIKATASLRRKRNHVPRRNDEYVVIQVFFLKSRNVGSDARSVRHAWLRLGDGVRDDNVEDFAHGVKRDEDVPTTWCVSKYSNSKIMSSESDSV